MKDLRKEIQDIVYDNLMYDGLKTDKLETICNTHADELAIGFTEWLHRRKFLRSAFGEDVYWIAPYKDFTGQKTTAELLTIYKATL